MQLAGSYKGELHKMLLKNRTSVASVQSALVCCTIVVAKRRVLEFSVIKLFRLRWFTCLQE